MPSDLFSFSVIILAVYRSICLRGGDASPPLYTVFCPVFGQARCPSGVSTLPNKGKHVAPPGHISFSSRAQYPTFSHTNIFLCLSLSPATQSPQSAIPSHYLSPHHSPSTSVLAGSHKTVWNPPDVIWTIARLLSVYTPGFASRQCVDNPKSVIKACLYFGILEEWILFVF